MDYSFPNFDIYSSPLLLLLVQGLIFVVLIGIKYYRNKHTADLILCVFLLLFCFERIHYTIGFMAWYDTFPNTKINYILFDMTLSFGPLIFFYIKSITTGKFQWKRKHIYHFIPFIVYVLYRAVLFLLDANSPSFDETQNGPLMRKLEIAVVNPLMLLASSIHLIIYLVLSLQLYLNYRKKIEAFYSNTYKLELNWIRSFLILYGLLFLYNMFQSFIDGLIYDMHWTQKWWYHLISSGVILYFGIKGYFTKTEKLQDLSFEHQTLESNTILAKEDTGDTYLEAFEQLNQFMSAEKPFLNPELNLKLLADELNWSIPQLSATINNVSGQNFNDYVNGFRVESVKEALIKGKHKEMSLVGIAYDSGFNSKATFNRVFKKLTSQSPSQFISTIN